MGFDSIQRSWLRAAVIAGLALATAGCVTKPNRAPVETRAPAPRASVAARPLPSAAPSRDEPIGLPLPGSENAGKPGYYSVKPGDTLGRIAVESGQNVRDLVRWNNLENPNLIEVGQVLRVVPPGADPAAATTRPVAAAKVETRPLEPRAAVPTLAANAAASASASAPAVPIVAETTPPPREAASDDDVTWAWPVASTPAPYNEAKAKGLVFSGKAGEPVLAAADGHVVYANSGLRGYGNLVILKHNAAYITAYAHNQVLLVKEGQNVKRGQKIAEMGSTDADSVQLHFELRKQGKPVDPSRLLPPR